MHPVIRRAALAAALVLAAATPTRAAEVVIDVAAGAVFDAVVDGYPMLAAFDGVPDFPTGYNTLSIGLQLGGTEERGIGEFPTASLPADAAAALRAATLVFNIDDVIHTFGPGTSFRGTASRSILIHLYAGNGEITVDDHLEIARPEHRVEPQGRITDQTLQQGGPLVFEVDVTDDVRAVLTGAPAAIGVVFRTTDSPSATSLDNLGDAGAGPPGVDGSFLPYLRLALDDVAAVCAGDCNGDGTVAINELVLGVAMGLGDAGDCLPLDDDGNGSISIDELVRAVRAALGGC